jgi:hypothetical protein
MRGSLRREKTFTMSRDLLGDWWLEKYEHYERAAKDMNGDS